MSIRDRLLRIHQCESVTWQTLFRMVQYDSTLTSIFQMKPAALAPFFAHNPQRAIDFYKQLHREQLSTNIKKWNEEGIVPICIFDSSYPDRLKQIKQPPWVLYTKGNIQLLNNENSLSVVGTRFPTEYGKRAALRLLLPLVAAGWTIVSGLAKGIDALAHQVAVNNGGTTIAVLGSGFHHIYPIENKRLAQIIAADHLLVSEYPPHAPPKKWHFPMRNRIISGMTKGTVIIEAKERSGSLITAYQALDEGREVFAVPGSIFNINSIGTNSLIKEGAKLTLTCEDILEEFRNGVEK